MLVSISYERHAFIFPVLRFVVLIATILTTIALLSDVAIAQTRVAPGVRNLGVSGFLGPEIDGKLVAFVVSEFQEGGTDLNGDGDGEDYVLHVHDVNYPERNWRIKCCSLRRRLDD